MDDNEVLTQTLMATIQRHARVIQNYETDIANMTAEIIRLQTQLSQLNINAKSEN